MLRSGQISASISAAAILLAGGCSEVTPPTLPPLAEIAEALSINEAPVVGDPTEVYARVARGAMACWFGTSGPLKTNYIYHAQAAPAAQGGKAEIVIHERDRNSDNPRGLRAFRVSITPEGESAFLVVENLKLRAPLAKSMEDDVHRWAAGAIGCTPADGDWAPMPPAGAKNPKSWKSRTKKKGREA